MKAIIYFTCIFTLISVHGQHNSENSAPNLSTEDFSQWAKYFPDYVITFDVLANNQLLVTIPNIKTITAENHQKYFERLKSIFLEITEISFNVSKNQFEILLSTSELTFDKTVAILRQFGIKQTN
jgi:hypothetical protein